MTSRTRVPVGYRFRPTDEELVNHYLKHKMLGQNSEVSDIAEVDVCKCEPWELPRLSAIKSDDQEWYFFCLWGVKHPNGNRTKRATESGYWKSTGRDREIKTRGTVIAKKKTLVFYLGRVPNGVRTNWVIHEYHPAAPLPHQRPFVLCRLKKKTDEKTAVSICDEGEASSCTASDFEIQLPDDSTQEVYIQPEANYQSFFGANVQQFPQHNSQAPSFFGTTVTNSHNDERNRMPFQSDADEVEAEVFFNSVFVDQDEFSYEEIIHNSSRAPEPLRMVYYADGGLSSDTDTDADQERSQSRRNSSLKAVLQDKAKDASRHISIVDPTQKEKSITDSDKAPKMAPVTNAKKSLKSTSGGSVGSDRKGYFTFQETSQPCHDSSPPLVYFVKLLFGIFLFLVVIREVLLYGNWC